MKIDPPRLSAARRAINLTQRELAAVLGVTVQAVSQWENGKTDATPRLQNLASALKCDPGFLIGKESENTKSNYEFEPKMDMVPILKFENVPLYFDKNTLSQTPEYDKFLYTTVEREGWMFAIEVELQSEYFNVGDFIVFDSGARAGPLDFAFILGLRSGKSQIFMDGENQRTFDDATPIVMKLPDEGKEVQLAPIPIARAVAAPPPNTLIILGGTLVEHRTFRPSLKRLKGIT